MSTESERTRFEYFDEHFVVIVSGIPASRIPMSEAHATQMMKVMNLVFCEGKQEGSAEAFRRIRELGITTEVKS